MSTQEQTPSLLAELPEESAAWRELHDVALLLHSISAAEDDVRNGRERPLTEAMQLLEQKWHHEAAAVFHQLDRVASVEINHDTFMNHFRTADSPERAT